MAKNAVQTYSRYSHAAAGLLGKLIREARIGRHVTAEQLAQRMGVSRGLVQRIERGDMGCAIGSVFEAAAILGVPLFTDDRHDMTLLLERTEKTLSLLPRSARRSAREVSDDF